MTGTAASLYSAHWYRIGPLCPRLAAGTRIRRQNVRGEDWFVLTHPVDHRHHRVNRKAYELIGRLDGERSLDAAWSALQNLLGDELPTQDEVIGLLSQLADAGLVLFDTEPDWSSVRQRQATKERLRNGGRSPFSFRFRLLDPDRLLYRLTALQRLVFHPVTLLFFVFLLLAGLAHAATEWAAIRSYAAINLLTPRYLFLTWLAYPFVKALHELGHALAVRRWGGEVREAGIAFMLLMPMPYVDASAATAFASKWQRAAVSSAGILVELVLAAAALVVWTVVEDGVVRDLSFVIMVIGGVSTVIFNANPLLRFDGYYILTDLLELPNLATRSQRWWEQRLSTFFLGRSDAAPDRLHGDEKGWIPAYAPASWIYRVGVSILIVQWLTELSPYLGLAALGWLVYSLLLKPLRSAAHAVMAPIHPDARAWRPLLRAGCVVFTVVVVVLWVPVTASTVAPGLVWLPEHSHVRTDSGGRVVSVLVRDGQHVVAGQPLLVMEEPALHTREVMLQAAITGAEVDQAAGWQTAGLRGRNAGEELTRLHKDLAQVTRQLDNLTLRAAVDGVFVMPQQEDLLHRDLPKGVLVAYVIPPEAATVRAAVAQDDIGLIRSGVRRVSVWLAEADGRGLDARVIRVDPAASKRLPGKALGDKGGGSLVTDPTDQENLTLLDPVFLVDVRLPDHATLRAGGRAWVRFDHDPQTLADILQLRARQLFLKAFDARAS